MTSLLVCGAVTLVSSGCNALLDNQRGRLDGDAPPDDDAGGVEGPSDGSPAAPDAAAPPASEPPSDDADAGSKPPEPDAGPPPRPTPECKGDQRVCAGACVPKKDPKACGPMCLVCPEPPNATPICASDACSFSCAKNFADCDAAPANGCEAALQSDKANCGKCGEVCADGYSCTRGKCRFLGIFGATDVDEEEDAAPRLE